MRTLSRVDPARMTNILSVCYKGLSDELRMALRQQRACTAEWTHTKTEYEWRLEYELLLCKELSNLCEELIRAVDLVRNDAFTVPPVVCIFQKKLSADFIRYSLECFKDISCDHSSEHLLRHTQCEHMYRDALHSTQNEFAIDHPLHQMIIMNYSVYLFEIKGDVDAALEMCQHYLEKTTEQVSGLSEDQQRLHQKIYDNVSYWTGLQTEGSV